MKKKTRTILSIALVLLILLIIFATIPISKLLDDKFNHGREILLKDGARLLALDSNGQPWVADSKGIGKKPEIEVKTLKNGSWISFTSGKTGLPYDGVNSLEADLNGKIWVATGRSGLLMYDGEEWTTFTTRNSGLSTSYINDIAVDPLDRIWVSYKSHFVEPTRGVTVFDGNKWSMFTTGNSDLLSNEVQTIANDPQGRVWMGMRGDTIGISILDDGKWISYTPENSGLKADAIGEIVFDADGRAWIVTYGAVEGINIFDGKTWEFVSPYDLGVLGREWIIPSIHPDPQQRIWISSWFGTKIYDGKNWLGLIGEDGDSLVIDDLAYDEEGRIWLTTSGELVRLDREYPVDTLWETRQIRVFFTRGWYWYLVMGLVCILLALWLDPVSPLAAAIFAGAFTTTAWSVLFSAPNLILHPPFVNPGIYAAAGALIGGMLGQWNKTLAKPSGAARYKPLIAGYSIGLAIGFCQLLPLLMMQ